MTFNDTQLDGIPQFQGLPDFAKEKIRQIMAQREEVCDAFVAKYGFEPERFVQENRTTAKGQEWSVRRKSDEEMERELIAMRARLPDIEIIRGARNLLIAQLNPGLVLVEETTITACVENLARLLPEGGLNESHTA